MSMSISFSEKLKHNNIDTWNKILNHNFITEIAENVLPIIKFIFYLKQDKIFLRAFCNLLTMASTITDDKEIKLWFEALIESTTKYEIPMQDEILQRLDNNYLNSGVSAENVTRDYITYMNSVSNSEDLALIVSAIGPCPWTYYEISNALIKKNVKSKAFKKWLQFYSSNESGKQVKELKQVLNKLARNASEKKKIEMNSRFSISCNYELKFWDMAYS
ncbi:MAG: thiaminase II [Nitrosopumilales archaeon]|jgi:thiaminase (transcriptional activator TenA)|nr:MAG: thiaminase II [Nitrosopumilales archaeon]